MRALVIEHPGQVAVTDIEVPSAAAGEVLLRVRMVGLCGSDVNSFRGKNPMVSFPRIPGHEIAATIAGLGEGVPAEFQVGMDVTLSPYTACGNCPACRRGRPNACRTNHTLGVQRNGALTEFITAPWTKLIPAPRLSLRELCLVEPLTVGFHAARRGEVAAGDVVAVLGAGTVGLGAIASSAHRGARVISVDIDDGKLALARKAGASQTVNAKREKMVQAMLDLTDGDGPDVVIEAVGTPDTFRAAVEAVAFTGRVVYIGYAKEPVCYETRLFVQKELDIRGSRNAVIEDFREVVEVLTRGAFPVEETITCVVPLEKTGEVLEEWSQNPAAFSKILVNVCE
ncbi:MAG: zinc-binding alcohol dehydrogenase family protein [Bryobacteraceae bacterium]